MAINFTPTDFNNLVRLMKLTATAGEQSLTLLTRNLATGALASNYLSAYHLKLLAEREAQIRAATVGDSALVKRVIQSLLSITDSTGVIHANIRVLGGVESLELEGFVNNQPAYVMVVIPHSPAGGFAPTSDLAAIGAMKDASLSVGPEANDVIRVSGQTNTGTGPENIFIKLRAAGVGTPSMAVVTGTSVKNNGLDLWMQTDASGEFVVDVTDAAVELVLFSVELDDGMTALVDLNFA